MRHYPADQIAFTALLVAMAATAVTLTAIAATGSVAPGDHPIADAVQSVPSGDVLEEVADVLANAWVETAVWMIGAFIALRKRSVALLVTGLLVAVALAANPLLKEIVDRARPAASSVTIREFASGEGFPSGHVQGATLIYGYAAYCLWIASDRRNFWAPVVAGAVVIVVGFDRIYNGVHWPSDVVGGFTFGLLLLVACIAAGNALARAPRRRSALWHA